MKIGIMTFPNSTSYGATLQMYALYRAVERLGAEAEIINYHNPYMKAEKHISAIRECSDIAGKLLRQTKHLMHLRQILEYRRFEKEMTCYPARPVDDPAKLPGIGKRYDCVICGSDQVWNPHITDTDLSYFLDFCDPDTKRIGYAPSFGISEFSEEFADRIRPELEQFSDLSVREAVGQQFVESLLNRPVSLVLDPTFLLSRKDWEKEEKACRWDGEPYILYYTVVGSPSLYRFCRELAQKHDLKMVVVGGNLLRKLRSRDKYVEYALDLSPREWLYLVRNARCVVTNSFHGTAFSIHYHKDFYLEYSSYTNSRLEQLLQITGLENRAVQKGCAGWDAHIDYESVEERLAPYREASGAFLQQAVWK